MATLPKRYVTPKLEGRSLRNLSLEMFDPGKYENPVIGDYGRREVGSVPVEYRLPAQFSPAVLASLSDGELESLVSEAKRGYQNIQNDVNQRREFVEDNRWKVMPRDIDPGSQAGIEHLREMGYIAVGDESGGGDEGGGGAWLSPSEYQAYKRNQALQQRANSAANMVSQIRDNAKRVLAERRQTKIRVQNQLAAGLADAGYELDLRGNAMEELWNNRNNLPGFVKTAGARNFIKRKGERFAYENQAFSPGALGIGYEGEAGGGGVELPPGYRPGPPAPQQMPYNTVDPLSEASYYGGQSADPNGMAMRTLDPNAPIGDSPLTNPGDWEPDPNYNPADGRMDMRYRRKLRPYGVDDRIVRDAGNTAYNNLRPGFYSAGSVTGPEVQRNLPGRVGGDLNNYAPNTEYPAGGADFTPPKINRWGAPEGRSLRPRTTMASFGLPTQTRIGV